MNPLKDLEKFGQAPWLDNLSRGLVRSGELAKLVQEEGIKGVTSNPAIFEKSMGHSNEYDEEIQSLIAAGKTEVGLMFNTLAIAERCNVEALEEPQLLEAGRPCPHAAVLHTVRPR